MATGIIASSGQDFDNIFERGGAINYSVYMVMTDKILDKDTTMFQMAVPMV